MTEHHDANCVKCFSFKGVIVGALAAFGLLFLFNILTVGGGLSAYTKTENGLETLVFLSYLWVVVGSFAIMFLSGFITSWVANHTSVLDHRNSLLHGLITWVLYIMISLTFLSQASETTLVSFPKSFFSMDATQADVDLTPSTTTSTTEETSQMPGETNPEERKEAHRIGLATLGAFFIFFVELMGACFGAWCGVEFKRTHRCKV